jgi:hypothetical protein
MFQKMIVDRACAAIDLFAECVHAEMEKAGTPKETRQALSVMFDNALICYQQRKGNDANTQAIIGAMRPRLKSWLNR